VQEKGALDFLAYASATTTTRRTARRRAASRAALERIVVEVVARGAKAPPREDDGERDAKATDQPEPTSAFGTMAAPEEDVARPFAVRVEQGEDEPEQERGVPNRARPRSRR